jgi:hypothetical protein
MIAQIKENGKAVAEIFVSGKVVSAKIADRSDLVVSFVSYLTNSDFIIGDPKKPPRILSAKLGSNGDEASFAIFKKFEKTPKFEIEILNPPKFETPIPEEGVVF